MPKAASKPDDEKQGRHRSPNYPAVSLPDAVERVKALVDKDGKAGTPMEAAAKHIGFSGAHGTARTVLSALKKFGLTSDQRGRVVPTQLAVDIINFPPDSSRNKAARQTAALSPLIYKQLVDQYAEMGNVPSPESLKPELIADMGFNPKAVDAFIRDFFSSLEYAGILEGNRLSLSGDLAGYWPAEPEIASVTRPSRAVVPSEQNWSPALASTTPGNSMRELTLPLMDNAVAFVKVPTNLTEENYDYLLQQISMMRKGLVTRRTQAVRDPDEVQTANLNRVASTPVMITHEMRRKLLDYGYTPAQIAEMTPQQAWIKIGHSEGVAFDQLGDEVEPTNARG